MGRVTEHVIEQLAAYAEEGTTPRRLFLSFEDYDELLADILRRRYDLGLVRTGRVGVRLVNPYVK